jgi:hypothetical protein
MIAIEPGRFPADLPLVKTLFREASSAGGASPGASAG